MNRRTLVKAMMASVAARPGVAQSRPSSFAPEPPPEVDAGDPLVEAGCIDVTKAPYFADSGGKKDATAAIQRAVNEARDYQYVCFFPSGTYLISDTISCEQPVRKLDEPRFTDGARQSYWNIPNRTVVLMGDTRGKRPVLKLAADAKGFDNPERPKYAVHIWAQTRTDAPGKEEPEWARSSRISPSGIRSGGLTLMSAGTPARWVFAIPVPRGRRCRIAPSRRKARWRA